MKSAIRNFLPWLPALLWMAGIFYFASRPTPLPAANGKPAPLTPNPLTPNPHLLIPWDKLAHVGEYAGLYFWLYFGFSFRKNSTPSRENPSPAGNSQKSWKTLGMIFGVSTLYALSDEVHQIFVIGRGFEYPDLVMDMVGMLGMAALIIIYELLTVD